MSYRAAGSHHLVRPQFQRISVGERGAWGRRLWGHTFTRGWHLWWKCAHTKSSSHYFPLWNLMPSLFFCFLFPHFRTVLLPEMVFWELETKEGCISWCCNSASKTDDQSVFFLLLSFTYFGQGARTCWWCTLSWSLQVHVHGGGDRTTEPSPSHWPSLAVGQGLNFQWSQLFSSWFSSTGSNENHW